MVSLGLGKTRRTRQKQRQALHTIRQRVLQPTVPSTAVQVSLRQANVQTTGDFE